jgi:hypothetical protein
MNSRLDPLSDEIITRFLRTRSADAELGLLDDIMRAVEATPQDRPWLRLRPMALPRRTLLVVAMALLLASLGAIAVGSRLVQPDPVLAMQENTIRHVVGAMNDRDLGALRSTFAADGALAVPSVDTRAGREGDVLMSEWSLDVANFPEVWMGDLEEWGLAAELGSCSPVSESTVNCAVVTRWHVLQLEIGEQWTFEFDGDRVTRLEMVRVDPDPPNRVLPLGFVDLARWEAWLRKTHPEQAERLLPNGPDLFGHFYFRFALDASPEEIGASIREYVASRP